MLNTGIISQARMSSTRLPGKILLSANGLTVLEHHFHRLKWSGINSYLATTVNKTDDCIGEYANKMFIPYHRGDEQNVLERFYQCAKKFELDIIIRVTSDCPLIDGNLIADGLRQYLSLNSKHVYYSNALVRTFPRGLDFEIFSFDLLEEAFLNAKMDSDKEHVTPYINQNRSGHVSIHHYTAAQDHSDLRWTLDTDDDWKLLKSLFEDYHADDLPYSSIIEIIQKDPELMKLNNHIKQKEIKL